MSASRGGENWAMDTEWGFQERRLDHESAWSPVVLCLVGLRSGRRLSFWGRDHRLPDFFRDHAGDLFISHSAPAEMKYLLRLGIPLPDRWFDTFAAWRHITNSPSRPSARLSDALNHLNLPHLAPAFKKELQRKIVNLEFNFENSSDRREITEYCFSDCDGGAALYERLQEKIQPEMMAHWIEYLKAISRMELRGIPFDAVLYQRVCRGQVAIRSALIGDINRTWPVYIDGSFSKRAFLTWCLRAGIDWPVGISPTTGKHYYPLDRETMKNMEGRHPFIGQVRQIEKTLKQLGNRDLVVDPTTGRHYFGTGPFQTITGRNAPRNFVFGGPKWLRLLIVAESPDHVLVYVDYSAQEIGIAAALSKDSAMRAMYEASDCHLEFAIRDGAAPPWATKLTHGDIRKLYKIVNLGVLYGQTAFGIANRLGISQQEAQALLGAHRTLFPDFWRWSEAIVQTSYDRRRVATPCGWCSRVPPASNERTWMNWPMQATGGDIMRLTAIYLDRQNVRLLALVHDGFLLSCRRGQLEDLRAAVNYACRAAVEHVLPGFPLRWDFTIHDRGRFVDEDGLPLWDRLQHILGADHVGSPT